MKPFTETDLIDYLSGELSQEDQSRLELELSTNPELQEALQAFSAMQTWLQASPEPVSTTSEATILAMLEEAEKPTIASGPRLAWKRWSSAAAAALLLFSAGWFLGNRGQQALAGEIANIRSEMQELMQQERSSSRIRAVSMTHELEVADAELIENLGRLLREDPSSNVRLAALEALTHFPNDLLAREELINSLSTELPAAVQIQLIETLVSLEEKRILPQLESWSQDETTPTHLRDAAQMGSIKLSRI